MRGFIFDLHGCVWTGDALMPGAVVGPTALDFPAGGWARPCGARGGGALSLPPTPDPRLPGGGDDFLRGWGVLGGAVAAAAALGPLVGGKPKPPLFELALDRM